VVAQRAAGLIRRRYDGFPPSRPPSFRISGPLTTILFETAGRLQISPQVLPGDVPATRLPMDPGSDDVEKGLGKLHLTMPRLDEKDVHNLATVSEASDGEWSSNVQMGEAGPAMTADAHNNPRSGSPVYGFGASDEYPDEPGFASRPPSLVFGTSGIRASLETQTSMFAVNERKSPGHTSATPHQLAPDFSWIVEHHNHELITTIRLQEPTHLAKLVQAVRKWRPWAARGGAATNQNIDANKTEWQREDSKNSFRISVAELHRIRMRKLQCKLASHAWYMKRFKKEPPDWEHDLQEYSTCRLLMPRVDPRDF